MSFLPPIPNVKPKKTQEQRKAEAEAKRKQEAALKAKKAHEKYLRERAKLRSQRNAEVEEKMKVIAKRTEARMEAIARRPPPPPPREKSKRVPKHRVQPFFELKGDHRLHADIHPRLKAIVKNMSYSFKVPITETVNRLLILGAEACITSTFKGSTDNFEVRMNVLDERWTKDVKETNAEKREEKRFAELVWGIHKPRDPKAELTQAQKSATVKESEDENGSEGV